MLWGAGISRACLVMIGSLMAIGKLPMSDSILLSIIPSFDLTKISSSLSFKISGRTLYFNILNDISL